MDLDTLAESARNRGLRLVRSRVRTPGKGDYGKVGITDAAGKPLLGFNGKALTATPEEAQAFLRKHDAADWGASLDQPVKRKVQRPRQPANDRQAPPKPERKPKPPPIPVVRTAEQGDAAQLLPLIRLLGYTPHDQALKQRLKKMMASGNPPFVATLGDRTVGLCGVQVSTMLQREKPVGRITILVVADDVRGKGIGRMLVDAAEARFKADGCELIEVTSNDRHLAAHAFYRRLGFERTSIRFAKPL
ncbi:GNAT family N-acetyltransferase [Sphingomonas piscis]|uniref:GNAT family N-acetyltransferase n=1 Tax=Sphingomonas piscis TaxID=2714943 RepID=A0A6G7YP15_9SPHN|nr:GNAT family N-acetyltransferase [Sphingomonas piscis]QIK78479.1 GNAT family N-acetyltransferase [Sphingomonas piscis]